MCCPLCHEQMADPVILRNGSGDSMCRKCIKDRFEATWFSYTDPITNKTLPNLTTKDPKTNKRIFNNTMFLPNANLEEAIKAVAQTPNPETFEEGEGPEYITCRIAYDDMVMKDPVISQKYGGMTYEKGKVEEWFDSPNHKYKDKPNDREPITGVENCSKNDYISNPALKSVISVFNTCKALDDLDDGPVKDDRIQNYLENVAMFHKIVDPDRKDGKWRGTPKTLPSSPMKDNNPAWVPDSEGRCSVCGGSALKQGILWSSATDRHHCRCCGALTCDPCSKKKYCVIGKKQQRFCTPCQNRFPRCENCHGEGKLKTGWMMKSSCGTCNGTGQDILPHGWSKYWDFEKGMYYYKTHHFERDANGNADVTKLIPEITPTKPKGSRRRESVRRLSASRYMTLYRDIPVLRRLSNEIPKAKESNTNTQSK